MKRIGLLMCLFMSGLAFGQQLSLQTTLPSSVKETSGLLYLHQRIITHNDSGGNAELYEIDPATGNVTRTVAVNNATNVDWEAICADDEYLYIGDFGNNAGSRTDLKIYRIRQSDYLEIDNDEVSAEVIHFAYADQTDFTPTNYTTNFDAEAFVALEDQLCIFTCIRRPAVHLYKKLGRQSDKHVYTAQNPRRVHGGEKRNNQRSWLGDRCGLCG